MNSMQVKDKLKNFVKDKNIDFNLSLKYYVFDRFIVRLSKSKYKDNFIIKGGFLLSALFGLENRSTMDIDASLANAKFNEENILKMVKNIINIDLEDNIKFEIKEVSSIRDEDEYGGYRIHLSFQFENIKERLKLDVATGDPITPRAITYKYKTILTDEEINIWSYNLETVLAEKLESIFSKIELSSRMKDYYDIYLIYFNEFENINVNHLRKAVENTFNKRMFNQDINKIFEILKSSEVLKTRWIAYSKKYEYTKELNYEDIMICLEKIINLIIQVTI